MVSSTVTISPAQIINLGPTAPLVWLHSQETYMPSDLQQQLDHTIPNVNWTSIEGAQSPLTLDNLDTLNDLGNTSVYLTSRNGIDASPQPTWFRGITPDEDGRIGSGTGSAVIVADRGNGTVDAFYFYFYAWVRRYPGSVFSLTFHRYNKGDMLFGLEFGDHIGDWLVYNVPLWKSHGSML
jgi:hypothetical protein